MPQKVVIVDQSTIGSTFLIDPFYFNDFILDITSIRVKLDTTTISGINEAGFTMPKMRFVLQTVDGGMVSPNEQTYLGSVDVQIKELAYLPSILEFVAELEAVTHSSVPGIQQLVKPFYMSTSGQGVLPGSYQVEVTIFYRTRIGTEVERALLSTMA